MVVGVSSGTWIAPIVVALVSALASYLLVVRKASGRIVTTEAGELWREASNLRDAYLADIKRLTMRLESVEGRVKTLEIERSELLERNAKLESENRMLRSQNESLRLEVDALKQRLNRIERTVEDEHKIYDEHRQALGRLRKEEE